MEVSIQEWRLFRLGECCTFQVKLISYMKYLLTIMIVSALVCSKNNENKQQAAPDSPTAKSVTCKTFYSSPSVPYINWSATLTIPDTNAVVKLSFRRVTPSYVAFEIDKPRSKSYTLIQPGYACPAYNDNAKFYFEWTMSNGSKKQDSAFQVWEQ